MIFMTVYRTVARLMTEDTQSKDRTAESDTGRPSVSRRRFVGAVGATGLATGLGVGSVSGQEAVTLQVAASEEEADHSDEIEQALYDAGMPDHIEIDWLAGGEIADDRRAQYQQWLAAGRSEPDLLRMDNGWTIPFIEREQLLNLSEELDDDELSTIEDEYFEMVVRTAQGQDGDIYGVPAWIGIPTMQYRKDLVEDAGYDPDGEDWATESLTWEEFSQVVADVLEQNDDIEHGYTFQADRYEGLSCCNFNEFITSWGGAYHGGSEYLFGPVGDRPVTVNEEPVHNAIRMVQQFIHGEHDGDDDTLEGYAGEIAPVSVLEWTEESSAAPFANGNAVAHRNWPFFVGRHGDEEFFGEDLGVMPIPYAVTEDEAEYPGTGGPTAALGGQHMTVNPNTENVEEALEMIRAIMSDEFNLTIFEVLGHIPPKPSVLESEEAADVPQMGRYVDSFRVGGENAMPRPVTVVWPDQSTAIADQANTALAMNETAENAMAGLEETLLAIEESV